MAAVLPAAHTTLGRFILPFCPDENPQVFNPIHLVFFLHLTLFAVSARFFYSPWEDQNLTTWAAPTFTTSPNISLKEGQPVVMAVATTQVKLCPYDEEEPVI